MLSEQMYITEVLTGSLRRQVDDAFQGTKLAAQNVDRGLDRNLDPFVYLVG